MSIKKSSWGAIAALTLVATAAGGMAIASAPRFDGDPTSLSWYEADNASVPDPDRTGLALGLYDADGRAVTTGTTTAPLPAFAVAGGALRAGDTSATLFVHAAQSGTAQGAWPGVQLTGTDRYDGQATPPLVVPAGLSGRPLVRTAGAATLADVLNGFASADQGTYAGVLELRLRTSSATAGVGSSYAGAYLRVSGTTWTVVDGPAPVDPSPSPTDPTSGPTDPTSSPTTQAPATTTTTATAPATAFYGRSFAVSATVAGGVGGTVTLREGARVITTATLGENGRAALVVPARAVQPGARTLTVAYGGSAAAQASSTTVRVSVAKAPATVRATLSAARIKRTAQAKVTVVVAATGVPGSGITGAVTVFDGKKRLTGVSLTAARNGRVVVTLPRLAVGAHSLKVVYAGNANVASASSAAVRLTVVR